MRGRGVDLGEDFFDNSLKGTLDDELRETAHGLPCSEVDRRSLCCDEPEIVKPEVREYALAIGDGLTDVDLGACFRDAMLRVHKLIAERTFGRAAPKSAEEAEADQRLLDGELSFYVPPGHTIVLYGRPQVSFKPTRLVIDDEAADWYDVVDIKVGSNSQLVSSGRLPGSAFKSCNLQPYSMDVAQASMVVSVSVVNVTKSPRRLPRMMMSGQSS